jgi:hypothetical protein
MKHTFTTKDLKEAKRIVKSLDMALVLFEITHNMRSMFDEFEGTSDDAIEAVFKEIWLEMEAHSIDINDLID